MRYIITLIYFSVVVAVFPSCISTRPIELKNTYEPMPAIPVESDVMPKAREWVLSKGYKLSGTELSPNRLEFTVPGTSWSWEEDKKIVNPSAALVIRKHFDVGGNRIVKPAEVNSTWLIESGDKKLVIKLLSAEAIYKAPNYAIDNHPGFSTGTFEKEILAAIQ